MGGSNSLLLVPKADNSSRLCTDFRKLNAVTITYPFPMPRGDGAPDKSYSFCKLDRKMSEDLNDFCAAYLDNIFSTSWE